MNPNSSPADQAMYRKISWRIMPLLLVAYVVAFLDRINVGYAQLQMKETLAFSDTVYAMGAGVFFIGYLLFEVPSNLMLERVGVRRTLLRIMVCWGVVAMAMMFVRTPLQFYVLRFLLGAFEAGFTPGALLYLTYWYPPARRARMIAVFLLGAIIAALIAGPLSGAIMKYLHGANDWHGWQWLFLLQGLPAPLLGLLAWYVLVDRPEQAPWLSTDEKARLRQQFEEQAEASGGTRHGSLAGLLGDFKVWALALVYLMMVAGTYSMVFWTPTLIRSWGVSDVLHIGIYATVPQLFAIAGVLLLGRSSDYYRERRWHFSLGALAAMGGLFVMILAQGQLVISLAGLSLAILGITSITPVFFALASEYLPRASVAAGIALISSVGNLGGAISPSITTALNVASDGASYSLLFVMGLYLLAASIVLAVARPSIIPLRAA
ncbi:MFS transporter [Pseudomonas nitroreducens]|uniref:MFS transporter n=1 Tax=Pseudomonas nitroreducens TaxID=46680 RepID=A0A246F958_PSENT|nr:MFS transporter [Pseudomonas nitroreducens]OWP50103.1 MFS transporter [Pseudomonas nitroreducens]